MKRVAVIVWIVHPLVCIGRYASSRASAQKETVLNPAIALEQVRITKEMITFCKR